MVLQAVSPNVGVPENAFEMMSLDRLKPKYTQYPTEVKVLVTVKKLPEPISINPGHASASPTDPSVISIPLEVALPNDDAGFNFFVSGVATAANMVDTETSVSNVPAIEWIKSTLSDVSMWISESRGLPEIDNMFVLDMNSSLKFVFNNGEPSSWRPLLAFSWGVFWLLSFIEDPDKRRGKFSPRAWCLTLIEHYARLQYIPQ